MNKAALYLIVAILYVLFPADLIPDVMPIVGWIDDLIIAVIAVYKAVQSLKSRFEEGPGRRAHAGGPQPEPEPEPEATAAEGDPYMILGIGRGASEDEIKAAYREKIAQYHPDKVQHLGEEFRELAEKKARAITAAYEELR